MSPISEALVPPFYAPLICKRKFGVLPSLLLQQGKKGETQEKKRVRHTHSARMFGRQSDETGNLDHELYFWKMRSHTPLSSFSFY